MMPQLKTELAAKHGEIKILAYAGHELAFRRPDLPAAKRFFDRSSGSPYDATTDLLLGTLVHPSREAFAEILARKPAAVMAIGGILVEWMGAEEVTVVENFSTPSAATPSDKE